MENKKEEKFDQMIGSSTLNGRRRDLYIPFHLTKISMYIQGRKPAKYKPSFRSAFYHFTQHSL